MLSQFVRGSPIDFDMTFTFQIFGIPYLILAKTGKYTLSFVAVAILFDLIESYFLNSQTVQNIKFDLGMENSSDPKQKTGTHCTIIGF